MPVTATKPLSGHLGAASGAVESIHALLMMQHRRLLPIANLEEPAADLRFVAGRGQEAELARGLHIARGIGGQNAAVVLGGALT